MKNFKNSKFISWLINRDWGWKWKLLISVPIIFFIIIIDWSTKIAALKLEYNTPRELIPGFINLHLIMNPGIARGFLGDNPQIAILLASISFILITVFMIFVSDKWFQIGISMIFGGSFANLFGRIWAPNLDGTHAAVIDFLKFDMNIWSDFIFNIADLFVTISVIVLILTITIYIGVYIYLYILEKKYPEVYERYSQLQLTIEALKSNLKSNIKNTNTKKEKSILRTKCNKQIVLEKNDYRDFKKFYGKNSSGQK